jgi:hypothetical protein
LLDGLPSKEDPDTAFKPVALRLLRGETATLSGGCCNVYARYGALYKSELPPPGDMRRKWHLSESEVNALTQLGPADTVQEEMCEACKAVLLDDWQVEDEDTGEVMGLVGWEEREVVIELMLCRC